MLREIDLKPSPIASELLLVILAPSLKEDSTLDTSHKLRERLWWAFQRRHVGSHRSY